MASLEIPQPQPDNHITSLEKIYRYPVVSDSLVLALSYYQWIKSKNSILDSSLTMIESTLKSVKSTTEPIVAEKLKSIDRSLSSQLDRLEKACPILLEPSATVASHPTNFYRRTLETSMKAMTWPVTKTVDAFTKTSTKSPTDNSHIITEQSKPISNDLPTVLDKQAVSTKVKRLSKKTQQRLYRTAIGEINVLEKTSVAKEEKLQTLMQNIQAKKCPPEGRVVEGHEDPVKASSTAPRTNFFQQASTQIEQLQDILTAIASVKKHATTNTLVSLHFVSSNLSLLRTALVINEKLMHQSIIVIDKLQIVIEYVMNKIKEYLKSQRVNDGDCEMDTASFLLDQSDTE